MAAAANQAPVALIRPGGYVALILDGADVSAVSRFFAAIGGVAKLDQDA